MITCDFLTFRRGKLITLAALAKMARGRMARFLIDNRIREPEGLREFSWEGYEFSGAQRRRKFPVCSAFLSRKPPCQFQKFRNWLPAPHIPGRCVSR